MNKYIRFKSLILSLLVPTTAVLTVQQNSAIAQRLPWIIAQSPTTEVSALDVTITTGGDDLREGSVAYGVVELQGGRTEKVNLNRGRNWRNNSTNRVSLPLPRGTRLADLVSFTLEHDGAPRRFPDGYDNWNVDTLKVATPRTCSAGVQLANTSGRPLVRLTGVNTFHDITLNAPSSARNTPISSLQVAITTGGDDLRGGSVAYGVIKLQNGTTLSKVNLNQGRNWPNNSTNTVTIPLPSGTKIGDLAGLRIEHSGAPRNPFDGYDNWNIDRVRIATPESCSAAVQLVNRTGRPLVRFTGGDTFRKYPINLR
ncbi:hypothetical protein ACQFX9_23175 [Aliinostoc sp. HNIBRCY26]|uniref:hypothetical protein n=1 Tax=Aliinostoc sp. HNIBRCY26 TaxID=3418997 RepID=UPI003D022B21